MTTTLALHMPKSDIDTLIRLVTSGYARAWSVSPDDVRQEAWLAVLRAAPTYDPASGRPGSYYATCIARALRRYMAKASGPVAEQTHRESRNAGAHSVALGYDELASDEDADARAVLGAVYSRRASRPVVEGLDWCASVRARLADLGVSPDQLAALAADADVRLSKAQRARLRRDRTLRAMLDVALQPLHR